jgi:hypothetical protein
MGKTGPWGRSFFVWREPIEFVMAGLVPAIHVFLHTRKKDVDARHRVGRDGDRLERMETRSQRRFTITSGLTTWVGEPAA